MTMASFSIPIYSSCFECISSSSGTVSESTSYEQFAICIYNASETGFSIMLQLALSMNHVRECSISHAYREVLAGENFSKF